MRRTVVDLYCRAWLASSAASTACRPDAAPGRAPTLRRLAAVSYESLPCRSNRTARRKYSWSQVRAALAPRWSAGARGRRSRARDCTPGAVLALEVALRCGPRHATLPTAFMARSGNFPGKRDVPPYGAPGAVRWLRRAAAPGHGPFPAGAAQVVCRGSGRIAAAPPSKWKAVPCRSRVSTPVLCAAPAQRRVGARSVRIAARRCAARGRSHRPVTSDRA